MCNVILTLKVNSIVFKGTLPQVNVHRIADLACITVFKLRGYKSMDLHSKDPAVKEVVEAAQ